MVKITLLATSTMAVLAGAAMSPALPAIHAQFTGTPNIDYLTRLVVTLPALLIAVNAPLAGYIVDRFGRMRVLVGSLQLLGLAGTSGYFATTVTLILAGRVFVGLGVAGVMTGATTLIADYYSGAERARILGLQTGAMGIAGTFFLIITGVLADQSWRAPFLLHFAALAVLPFVLILLHEPWHGECDPRNQTPVGEPGTCAGESTRIESPRKSADRAVESIPVRLVAFIYGVMVFSQIIFYIIPIQLPFYLTELLGASAIQSGFSVAFITLSFALTSIFLGKKMARRDHITVLMEALVIVGLGYTLVSISGATVILYAGLVVAGVGLGILIPNMYVWLANETPVAYRGRILGGFTTALFLGQFLSPLVVQPVINSTSIGRAILLAGVLLVAAVPLVFVSRGQLRKLTASPGR